MGRGRSIEAFPTDEPLVAEALIGRAEDLREITTRMRLGANTVMASPRRTGKTSICDAVLAELAADPDFYVAHVDLFALDSISEFADALITETLANRSGLRRALHAAKQTGRTLYDSVGVTITAKMLHTPDLEGIDLNLLPTLPQNPARHLDYAIELPQHIASTDSKRLVLFIDEFQDVKRIGENWKRGFSDSLKRKMRTAFQRSPDVSFLFAGSLEHMMSDLFGNAREPFFQFGSFHQLRAITEDDWHDGLTEKLSRDGTDITSDALRFIIDKGESHPRTTMLLAQKAHLAAVMSASLHVDMNVATIAYEDALREERSEHEAYIARARDAGGKAVGRLAVPTLRRIASGQAPYGATKDPAAVARTLDALRDTGLIVSAGSRKLKVVDPLFAEYLRRGQL